MCVLKEIPVITFSLWHIRLLASLMCRYGHIICMGMLLKRSQLAVLFSVLFLPSTYKLYIQRSARIGHMT